MLPVFKNTLIGILTIVVHHDQVREMVAGEIGRHDLLAPVHLVVELKRLAERAVFLIVVDGQRVIEVGVGVVDERDVERIRRR